MWFAIIEHIEHDYHNGGEIRRTETLVSTRSGVLDKVENLDPNESIICYGPITGETVITDLT